VKSIPHVALLVDTSISYQRDALHGIARYVCEHRPWNFYVEQEPSERIPNLNRWQGDGIITAIRTPRVVQGVKKMRVPVVSITGTATFPAFPLVCNDDRLVGLRAAEHFLERGHRRFAFCGYAHSPHTHYSRSRMLGFVESVEEAGFACRTFKTRRITARDWDAVVGELVGWIRSLEKPVGIMACNDVRARHVLEACREAGVHVPDEAAVVGVDNDAIMCKFSTPPLSSVDLGAKRIGYRAAETLDRLMAGKPAPSAPVIVEPGEVACRQSSDVLAVEDRHIAHAIRFIREHACEGITVAEALDSVPLNRRALERRFKKALGRSPHSEIHRVRITRARELLATTELTTEEIADRCGFTYVQYLRRVFLKSTGMTPGQYRRKTRQF
jgi:LacI family transcriptional regulator